MSGVHVDLPCRAPIHCAGATTALRLGDCSEETLQVPHRLCPDKRGRDSAHARTNPPVGAVVYVSRTGAHAQFGVSVYVNTRIHANVHRHPAPRPSDTVFGLR